MRRRWRMAARRAPSMGANRATGRPQARPARKVTPRAPSRSSPSTRRTSCAAPTSSSRKANTEPQQAMALGNGTLGMAAWAANGFTAQLNRTDTFPDRKSLGQVVIPGLAPLASGLGLQRHGRPLRRDVHRVRRRNDRHRVRAGGRARDGHRRDGRGPELDADGADQAVERAFSDRRRLGRHRDAVGDLAGLGQRGVGGRPLECSRP